MKIYWYSQIYHLIEQALFVKIPFEVIHFPSSGVVSAMNRYAELSKQDPEFPVKCMVLDMRMRQFNKGPEENRAIFFEFIKSQMEQYLDFPIGGNKNENIYKTIHKLINKFLQEKKKVLIIFSLSTPVMLDAYPDFRDFLSFLDNMRSGTAGRVNFIISTTCPQFSDENPPPFSVISKYFQYYDKGVIYRAIRENVLNTSGFKKHQAEDVLKLVDMSGGLIAIVKNLIRDFVLQDKKLDEIYKLKFDRSFFEEYQCIKFELDSIKRRLKPEYVNAIYKIANGVNITTLDNDSREYLTRCNVLDENNNLRSQILAEYIKLFPEPVNSKINIIPQILKYQDQEEKKYDPLGNSDLLFITKMLTINIVSGEISTHGIPQDKYLTQKEVEVIKFLYGAPENSITREELGNILWDDNSQYSDWAIDKTISRIREKIRDDKPYKVIKTLRNSGFRLEKENSVEKTV